MKLQHELRCLQHCKRPRAISSTEYGQDHHLERKRSISGELYSLLSCCLVRLVFTRHHATNRLGYVFTRLVAVRNLVSPVNLSLDAVRTLGDYIGELFCPRTDVTQSGLLEILVNVKPRICVIGARDPQKRTLFQGYFSHWRCLGHNMM